MTGRFCPSLLERRRGVDTTLYAVVMEAALHGASTRKVDDLVTALGVDSGLCMSEVSLIREGLDADIAAFRDRPGLADADVVLDATYCLLRVDHRVASSAIVVR